MRLVVTTEFTVLQRNLKEWHERPWRYVLRVLKERKKVGSTATVSRTVYSSYPMLPFGTVSCDNPSRLEITVYSFITHHSNE